MIWCINSVTTNEYFFLNFFNQMRGASPFRREWEVVAPQPGSLGGRHRAAPLPSDRSSRDPGADFLQNFLQKSPCRPAAGRPGAGPPAAGRPEYIPVNFENKNIFLQKLKLKNIKLKKARLRLTLYVLLRSEFPPEGKKPLPPWPCCSVHTKRLVNAVKK